ncbi:FAD-linked oxidase C-terminal domain-containing protein [Fulvimarina sp. 2208YS6-2-32]|uniref:D-lactate dehydrogenase (cytochrome) n=1 Tax=Fulvimarina uroteuthidis TaxID=3098149 RepID=A0ABU5I4J8_9HYPH|nr:FAD-linked oxidase C-terminal domain-containing protein [Fulvimarina sp. 2208YS6-2-32]MDY8109673.1 FAD-linked oxidase C-terminal domain-containing protein [Fulvimarina sp. 2208YS6-2-32]
MALAEILAEERPRRAGTAAALAELAETFGERLVTGEDVRRAHGHTTTYIPNQLPDAVLFAKTESEVQTLVRIAARHGMPIIPFGVGSSLEGHVNAPFGGVSLDLSGMDRVLQVNAEDLDCTVEPGVTREALNAHLRDTGLFFPIDPGANASLGGMAATRASGTNAVRYGTMRDNVIALHAVMADGTAIRTARRARKTSAGYDLTRLLVGSEGTLGVITRLNLKLYGIPEEILSGTCPFEDVTSAVNAVIQTVQMGLPIARIELLDALSIRATNAHSKMDMPETPHLFVEFHGSPASVTEQAATFAEIVADHGGGLLQSASRAEERSRLWKARHDFYWASMGLRPGAKAIATDVCVPVSRLADCIDETRADADSAGLIAPIVGHVGDGNFHVTLLIDTDVAAEVANAEGFMKRLAERALDMDGTCTGEHGVGQGKRGYLDAELGAAVNVMRSIKTALDPLNIMNPGKIFTLPQG